MLTEADTYRSSLYSSQPVWGGAGAVISLARGQQLTNRLAWLVLCASCILQPGPGRILPGGWRLVEAP